MTALFGNPEFWVAAGLLIFFGLLVGLKVPRMATAQLDARSGRIKAALDEAQALRAEAQALLDGLKARREAAEADARRMLADAEVEARRLEADAHAKLEEQIARRSALADRRIALAETQAAAEVKAAAARLAGSTAQELLSRRLTAGAGDDPLVERAIQALPGRLQ